MDRLDHALRPCHAARMTATLAHADTLATSELYDVDVYVAFARWCTEEGSACSICGRVSSDRHYSLPVYRLSPRLGGRDDPDNLRPACSRCQMRYVTKSDEMIEAWFRGGREGSPPDFDAIVAALREST